MSLLDEKIARLSADQRREVETFVDFLLQRESGNGFLTENGILFCENPKAAPPHPIIMADEIRPLASEPPGDPLPVLSDIRPKESRHEYGGGSVQKGHSSKKDPGLLLDWID